MILMKIIQFIKNLFSKKEKQDTISVQENTKLKTLVDIQVFDDVTVSTDNELYEGWIAEIIQNQAVVVYTDKYKKLQMCKFTISRPLNRTEVEFKDGAIYLNPKNISE